MEEPRSSFVLHQIDNSVYVFGGSKKPSVEMFSLADGGKKTYTLDVNATFLEGMSNDGQTFNKTEEGISVEYSLFCFYPLVAFRWLTLIHA